MSEDILHGRDFLPELLFSASRSAGPGGQSVNKVSSKVELRFSVRDSLLLSPEEKEILLEKLTNRINREGELVMTSQSERSQAMNKVRVTEKFFHLLEKTLKPRKKRKRTKPSRESKEKRLESKKIRGEKKELRRKIL
jgi:ribosome-associated protein